VGMVKKDLVKNVMMATFSPRTVVLRPAELRRPIAHAQMLSHGNFPSALLLVSVLLVVGMATEKELRNVTTETSSVEMDALQSVKPKLGANVQERVALAIDQKDVGMVGKTRTRVAMTATRFPEMVVLNFARLKLNVAVL
jgi:hypothetical protein